ncbi:ABC transporter permease [Halobellus salinisoli]|uniref:ABC transporter permease n=1 Tax=Halobellus salinisoli TaxID=3108500 RepID=UPI00300B6EB3
MSRTQYYLRRTIQTALLIAGVSVVLFTLFRLMPGSYLTTLTNPSMTPEQIERLREMWGLNDPIYIQYISWVRNLATGNAGTSLAYGEPVLGLVGNALRNSFVLALPGILGAFAVGSLYGTLLGLKQESWIDRYGPLPPTLVGVTPDFFMAMILLTVFSGWFNVFPAGGMASLDILTSTSGWQIYTTGSFWVHYVLPFATIVLGYLYYPALIMRGSIIDVKDQEFTKYQRAVGLAKWDRIKNIMKHASLPVITTLPASTSRAISGLVLIELIFNWPGIGTLLFESVLARDTPVIQFMFLIIAVWIIVGNFVVDIFYTVIDPRISLGEE